MLKAITRQHNFQPPELIKTGIWWMNSALLYVRVMVNFMFGITLLIQVGKEQKKGMSF